MWTRAELKTKAKENFKRNYWMCVLVSIVIAFLVGAPGAGGSSKVNDTVGETTGSTENFMYQWDSLTGPQAAAVIGAVIGVVVVLIVIVGLFSWILINPLIVGCKRFFVENRQQNSRFGTIGFAFKSGRYGNVVLTMFLKGLFLVLWYMLFCIPGIIKSYSYWMIDYILAENPSIGYKRAFAISRQTMDGEKWNTFVLILSFIGWAILASITCGLAGVFYVNPYLEATKAELYAALREKALANGIATSSELPGC